MKIVRCKNCSAYDANRAVVVNANDPRADPDFGFCRRKLPKVKIIPTPQGPVPFTYHPRMHKDAGCCKGTTES